MMPNYAFVLDLPGDPLCRCGHAASLHFKGAGLRSSVNPTSWCADIIEEDRAVRSCPCWHFEKEEGGV